MSDDAEQGSDSTIAIVDVVRADESTERLALEDGDSIRIGRVAPPNDLAIDDSKVSRFHAVLNASSFGVILSDLSSTNGTFINGRRVSTPVNIVSGDSIGIGDAKITVRLFGIEERDDKNADTMTTQAVTMKSAVITVLVADVRQYTQLSEALPAADVAAMLQAWFERVSDVVEKYNGEVDKYIGDCVMGVWKGTKSTAGEIATKAAQAAREILLTTAYLADDGTWAHGEKYPWRCKISLNTGEAFTGPLGGRGARDFTVIGDTVNVAFRLDKVASERDAEILMSGDTAELIKDSFQVASLGAVKVDGRVKPVEIYTMDLT